MRILSLGLTPNPAPAREKLGCAARSPAYWVVPVAVPLASVAGGAEDPDDVAAPKAALGEGSEVEAGAPIDEGPAVDGEGATRAGTGRLLSVGDSGRAGYVVAPDCPEGEVAALS